MNIHRFILWLQTACLFALVTVSVCAQDNVSTGPDPLSFNDNESIYLRGLNADSAVEPVRLRILGARSSMGSIVAQVVALDKKGNFIRNADRTLAWTSMYGCRRDPMSTSVSPAVNEQVWRSITTPTLLEVIIDNSLTSDGIASPILRSLRDKLPGFAGRDSIGIITYSHIFDEVSPIASYMDAASAIDSNVANEPGGLAATYTTMFTALKKLEDHKQSSNILVVVTASNDAASLPSMLTNVIRKANAIRATIHVIKIGTSAQGYIYRYITAASGGRLYSISTENISEVADIIREIAYGSKQHFEVTIPVPMIPASCDDLLIKISAGIEGTSDVFADTILVPRREKNFYSGRSIVAMFPDTTDRGLKDYYPILTALAEELMSDPAKHLQLVGHVSADLKGDADQRALERAGYVADFLKAYGVKESQIGLSSDGNRKPVYYLQLDGTQRLMNNRVEAYFISDDDFPYTIVVDQFATEEQAIKGVESWESRGYKAFFEPIVVKRAPAYRLKLWGYRSRPEAEKAMSSVRKLVKTTVFIE